MAFVQSQLRQQKQLDIRQFHSIEEELAARQQREQTELCPQAIQPELSNIHPSTGTGDKNEFFQLRGHVYSMISTRSFLFSVNSFTEMHPVSDTHASGQRRGSSRDKFNAISRAMLSRPTQPNSQLIRSNTSAFTHMVMKAKVNPNTRLKTYLVHGTLPSRSPLITYTLWLKKVHRVNADDSVQLDANARRRKTKKQSVWDGRTFKLARVVHIESPDEVPKNIARCAIHVAVSREFNRLQRMMASNPMAETLFTPHQRDLIEYWQPRRRLEKGDGMNSNNGDTAFAKRHRLRQTKCYKLIELAWKRHVSNVLLPCSMGQAWRTIEDSMRELGGVVHLLRSERIFEHVLELPPVVWELLRYFPSEYVIEHMRSRSQRFRDSIEDQVKEKLSQIRMDPLKALLFVYTDPMDQKAWSMTFDTYRAICKEQSIAEHPKAFLAHD
jgi:hypothetical protein